MADRIALIADDDEYFRVALRVILTNELGFQEVIEASSLDEAIECLPEREDISLALFDLDMPGMEGPTSLKAVREGFKNLRVAVVSASNIRTDILMALEAGVHGYVPKGLGVRELSRALQLIVGGHIYVPPCLAELPLESLHLQEDRLRSSPAEQPMSAELTPRQREVLHLLVQGLSNKEIARALNLGDGTIKIHVAALFRVLGVSSRTAAAVVGAKLLTSA